MAHLEKRIALFKKTAYRASRGSQYRRLKRVRRLTAQMEAKQSSIFVMREQIAWHHAEVERLNTLMSSEGIGKPDGWPKES